MPILKIVTVFLLITSMRIYGEIDQKGKKGRIEWWNKIWKVRHADWAAFFNLSVLSIYSDGLVEFISLQ